MRQKLYYTTDEITNNLYTTGSEWMLSDGTEYMGLYHQYITGEIYTESTWNVNLSKKLIKYVRENDIVTFYKKQKNINVKYDVPKNSIIQITSTDIKNGFIYRYFVKKINDSNIIELDNTEFIKYESNQFDPLLYSAVSFKWLISGNLNDNRSSGVFKRGVITTNRLTIEAAEAQMAGLSKKITDYTEYYLSTDINVPKDINQ
jgi:hypothetical protein